MCVLHNEGGEQRRGFPTESVDLQPWMQSKLD